MTYNFQEIESKWQKVWEDQKLFEAVPDKRPKYFLNFPYPYINAYQHIGHLYTLMRVEAFARYKRLRGFNVLFAQGWHATGSPIVQAAKRVKDREPKQMKIMEDMGFIEEDYKKFEDPKYWIEFFAPEFKKDFSSVGLSVDWRREFHTTSINPRYDKFIKWQLRILKEKGYCIKGKFPVVWDPKENAAVGDHDRVEGEGVIPQEFVLVKHKLPDGRMLVSATLRPDTILGITNLYVHPEVTYVEAEVNGEIWIIGEAAAERLTEQGYTVEKKGSVKGTDLIGKKTKEFGDVEILILPATFISPDVGTGLVHSVPSDSADDLIALRDLQKDKETLEKYGLNEEEVIAIQPIPILNTPEFGDIAADAILKKYGIKSQNERAKLDQIRKELYKASHYSATFNEKYESVFGENLKGLKVEQGKEIIKKHLEKEGWTAQYFELTGKVVSRSLTECIIKIVDDQWFIDYDNPDWKKQAHKCLDAMKLYPEKARTQFDYVIDWLHAWACTREEGLGTRLPWDEKWLIESLSDSTIYMAFYTINHILKEIPEEQIDDALFDYTLLDKDVEIKVDKEKADAMRAEFNYWYPVDFRNSGKDLIQNHLTFFIFNHTAIFPEKHWPKGIGANGFVTVDGQKMSKSLGNMIPVREITKRYGADASRFTILAGGESLDDPNWETKMAESLPAKFEQLMRFFEEHIDKGREDAMPIDDWMISSLHTSIKEVTEAYEATLFRTALQKTFFDLQKNIRWYLRRCGENPSKQVMNQYIKTQLLLLTPIIPHFAEEAWERLGKKDLVMNATWPKCDEEKVLDFDSEGHIRTVLEDVASVKKLAKIDQLKSVEIFIADDWKYECYNRLREIFEKTRNMKEILAEVMQSDLKKHGKEITKIIPKMLKQGYVPEVDTPENEKQALEHASDFLKKEFGAEFRITFAKDAQDPKAKQASPGKPALVVS